MQRDKRVKKGFTLLEILLVIAAIGILASIVLVAINPTKQLAQIRNTQRLSDINTIFKAIEQNTIDTGGAYPGTVGVYKDICPIGSVNTSCIDLSGLVPIYMAGISVDPRGGNYKIGINPDNNRISIKAPNIELGKPIWINSMKEVEYLVIAGGGGGAVHNLAGAGGGAGGFLTGTVAVTNSYSTVTIGAGGGGAIDQIGDPGHQSELKGAGGNAIGTPTQGYRGGNSSSNTTGGSGGGAGGIGQSGNGILAGGLGLSSSISGSSAIYATGGGARNSQTAGNNYTRPSAAANTGNGGDGQSRGGSTNVTAGSGGSGIVIIRYKTDGTSGIVSATGGTKTTVGDYTIHTFTTSGTFSIVE